MESLSIVGSCAANDFAIMVHTNAEAAPPLSFQSSSRMRASFCKCRRTGGSPRGFVVSGESVTASPKPRFWVPYTALN